VVSELAPVAQDGGPAPNLLAESHPDHLVTSGLEDARAGEGVATAPRTGRTLLPLRPLVAMLGVFLAALCIVATPLLEQKVVREERAQLRSHLVAVETLCARALLPAQDSGTETSKTTVSVTWLSKDSPLFAEFPLYALE
jgi:hypothetical protein